MCLAVALTALIPGCWNPFSPPPEDDPPPPPPQYDRSTRDNLMGFFAKSHENREILEYEESLHPDYIFWFWENEDLPDQWSTPWIDRAEDVRVTKNMFESEQVTSITAVFTNLTTDGDSGSWYAEIVADGEDSTVIVFRAEYLVDLQVVVDTEEITTELWVRGKADIHVVPDPKYEGLWTIWKIKDRTDEHKAASTTWGSLKREFD